MSESYLFAFFQRLETRRIDIRMMNKYIRTIFLLNEALSPLITKPLYRSICHRNVLLLRFIVIVTTKYFVILSKNTNCKGNILGFSQREALWLDIALLLP